MRSKGRHRVRIASLFALLLIACRAGQNPTNTPPPTAAPTDAAAYVTEPPNAVQTLEATGMAEPIHTPNALPRVIHHEPPERVGDETPFTDAGCSADEVGGWTCRADSPLTDLGCAWIGGPFGGLDPPYPIALCWTGTATRESRCAFQAFCHPDICAFCYVTFQEGRFGLIETEEALRETFAPIDGKDEALVYAEAVMAGRLIWPFGPSAYYGLEVDPTLEYAVDVIEDTHVEAVSDGYLVHLFLYDRWGCEHPAFYAVDVHVTHQGQVKEASKEVVYTDPSGRCVE